MFNDRNKDRGREKRVDLVRTNSLTAVDEPDQEQAPVRVERAQLLQDASEALNNGQLLVEASASFENLKVFEQ